LGTKKVKTIPATIRKYTAAPIGSTAKKKVAGYARVSTDDEDQQTSYDAQVSYYTQFIKDHDEWEFVKVYTDDGISGTNTKHREGFKSMIADALDGKIDLIVTKSVSRFARNTVDSLETIRKLKEKGIEVFFQKENIWTLDSKGELLITIMSSLAQEESRSISENVTWGHRRRFAAGRTSVAYSRFLGYDRKPGRDGGLIVNPEEAETIRLIYKLFLEGLSYKAIARKLTEEGYGTPGGQKNWASGTVRSILTNEKYKGDALLQKTFTVDFLTKTTKVNEGEVPQYYVEHDHEAIIDPETFDIVQEEIEKRRKSGRRYSGVSIFSSKIRCGQCGGWYGTKVWHSTDKYRRVIYQCNNKYGKGKKPCSTPHFTEDEIKEMAVKAINKAFSEKKELIENAGTIRDMLTDTAELEKQAEEHRQQRDLLADMVTELIGQNATVAQDQAAYQEKYDSLAKRYEAERDETERIESEISHRKVRAKELDRYIRELQKAGTPLTEFDEDQWCSLVDYITVYSDKDIRFTMKDGTAITI
jgi:site-specific DNA recombinase